MGFLRISTLLFALLLSCSSYHNRYAEKITNLADGYYGSVLEKYRFQSSQLLNKASRDKLQLRDDKSIQYVLFEQYYRNSIADSPGKERLYIVGEHRLELEETLQPQEEFHDLLLIIELVSVGGKLSRRTRKGENLLQFSLHEKKDHMVKNFVLSVQDFSGDGLDDFFVGFERDRGQTLYYLYSFHGMEPRAIVRPWSSFSEKEQQDGTAKYHSPFMRELSADIYPAFVAEIELDLNYKINIDLSPLADDLIRDKIYDKQGMVLQKRGIPHLDFNPILFPVRHNSRQYMLRSAQQVRNRYGQIGIFVCDWIFHTEGSQAGEPANNRRAGRWIPDESNMEFLAKPRI